MVRDRVAAALVSGAGIVSAYMPVSWGYTHVDFVETLKDVHKTLKYLKRIAAKRLILCCDANTKLPGSIANITGLSTLGVSSTSDESVTILLRSMAKFDLFAMNTSLDQEKVFTRNGWDGAET